MIPPILTLILAGGRSERLHALGRVRTASALPFGGKYRVIDFSLSNCTHSGLFRIAILTQYAPLSLQGHIGIGKPWDLDRRDGGVRLLPPYVRQRHTNWYRGTADALVQNRNVLADAQARHFLVLSGDLVYKMDYGRLIEHHEATGAALTIVTTAPPSAESDRYGYVTSDLDGRVTGLVEKPETPAGETISAGVYLFRARDLSAWLAKPDLGPDLVRDVIRPMIASGARVVAHPHADYWRDVGTIDAYYEASMELLRPVPSLTLHDPDWLIYTPSEDRAPALITGDGDVSGSLVAHGAHVEGTVRRSILFPGVFVAPGAVVEDSIVMHDARILPNARLSRAIVDKNVRIGEDAVVGTGPVVPNREWPRDLASGVCVIGKGAEIPPRGTVGRNSLVEMGVRETDLRKRDVEPGVVVRAGTEAEEP
ncbi:MAG TPA: glucose-1-phosphate adenylyltransferase family protein [Candidatus Eisenbacteria bacterium]|nr:glucose-1-phosphate adenylyltransferase family protein [Candidatus Eisenbacteria bacterium]